MAALICSGSFGKAVIICFNSGSVSVMVLMPELLDLGSFWPVVFLGFSLTCLFVGDCVFLVAGSNPVSPSIFDTFIQKRFACKFRFRWSLTF